MATCNRNVTHSFVTLCEGTAPLSRFRGLITWLILFQSFIHESRSENKAKHPWRKKSTVTRFCCFFPLTNRHGYRIAQKVGGWGGGGGRGGGGRAGRQTDRKTETDRERQRERVEGGGGFVVFQTALPKVKEKQMFIANVYNNSHIEITGYE